MSDFDLIQAIAIVGVVLIPAAVILIGGGDE